MNTDNLQILEALETLAAAFPWDTVEIVIDRKPEGTMLFSAWVRSNEKLGLDCDVSSGDTAIEAVGRLVQKLKGKRDPNKRRLEKIAELQDQIAKLEAVVLGLPPYRPNRELAQINLPKVREDIVV